jgi:hypothetical protein
MAVGLPAKTTYADGDVFSASDINDTNGTLNLVGQTNNTYAAKNLLINGLLDIWQRGTTVTGSLNGYATVDRWYLISNASCTFAQETSIVPEGCRYSQKVTVGASASSTQAYHAVETSNVVAYAGKNITFSGRFRSSATPTVTLTVEYSNDVDKALAVAGWTAITATSTSGTTAGSAAFNTISGVYAIPSTAKSLRFSFNTTSMASGSILYYGGFQAELGSVVTSLVRNGATIQGELAACQRYYWRFTGPGANAAYGSGSFGSSTGGYLDIPYPTAMRTAPGAIDFSLLAVQDAANGSYSSITALTINQASLKSASLLFTIASGGTTYRWIRLINDSNTAGYLGLSAEL